MTDKYNGRVTGKKKNPFQILFRNSIPRDARISPYTIIVVPSNDDWNDFGFRTLVDVDINTSSKNESFSTKAYIGFLTNDAKEPNGTSRLKELLKGTDLIEIPGADSHRFFTMLPTMEAYRELVIKLGVEDAAEALRSLRDLVVLTEFKNNANWLDLAVTSEVFLKSFMRTSDSYYAFKNAGSILRGLANEKFGRLSDVFDIKFTLPGRANSHELSFRFNHDSDLPKRIAIVIGKNGVGKSQTLGRIVRSALEGSDELRDGVSGDRVLVNRILAFAPTTEAGSVFPTDRRKRPKVWYKRFSLNRMGKMRKGFGVSDQVIQVARSEQYLGETSRWDIFVGALAALDNWHEIALPVKDKSRPALHLSRLKRGGEERIVENYGAVDLAVEPIRLIDGYEYPLSSGEISFVRFAAQASLHIENGSLLLLDEPETHLHPNFISQFASLLNSLLKVSGSAAIIATHSAYFVREVFREQVSVLRTDTERRVTIEKPILRTFGADVGAISYFVFGEDEPSQLAAEVEERLLGKNQTWKDIYSKYKDELSLELLGTLRESLEGGSVE